MRLGRNKKDELVVPTRQREDYKLAIQTVEAILSYIKKDSDNYNDISAAVLEFKMLSEAEKEVAFFYVLGQLIEFRRDKW